MDNNQTLKWRFDISTFRLIGRDLITDRVTALFELIKNCYDANAQNVVVSFENVSAGRKNAVIRIEDDGYGMSFKDIRDKWMVIGTSSKRTHPYSPEPYNRKCVGEKGIGRFAVDKLGDFISIITKTKGEDKWLKVNIDWGAYYREMSGETELRLFTDMENTYSYIDSINPQEHGTKLIISDIREAWTKKEIEHLMREISKIVSPFANLSFPFKVKILAPEFDLNQDAIKTLNDFDLATVSLSIEADTTLNLQQSLFYDKKDKCFGYHLIPLKSFGGIKMNIYFFDDSARRKYRKEFPNDPIDGFKVYRDGIIATPFAETNEDSDLKRDILGIDKRLWKDIFNRVSTREFIGTIEITSIGNPKIIDATNRQDFVDNEEYRELKRFIMTQLNALQEYKIDIRQTKRESVGSNLNTAAEDISSLESAFKSIVEQKPELKPAVAPLLKQVRKTSKSVKTAISEQKKVLEEFTRKENIYMSIMSLQQFAITITHAVRTTLNQIRDRIEYFYRYYPDPEEEELFKLYAKQMYERFEVLNRVINYMLSYSQSNMRPEEVDLKKTFEEIMGDYIDIFSREGISLQTHFPENLVLNTNRQFFRDILQNIIDNSIKAMKDSEQRMIRCSYEVKNDILEIIVSDTGKGIPQEEREQVFALYHTTTENQGGAGVGLYIVKTRVESLRGTVNVVESEFGEVGTTIKITIPFKK
ncbi:sensor histidine kinase [Prevotella melaninogenica]|uniref:histidine kinase n=1 Tax=Prevotella melaninogenica TaxID=28132 RepID=A0ABX7XSK7_9BACT|nr:sensor histidine kinase [Prevotella melaninogenica]QUB76691.1 sensor histidine kinase [Prevotella melaninogenica]